MIAIDAISDIFTLELSRGQVQSVKSVGPCTILAIVGDALRQTTGVAGRFFGALGASKINVLAISQGSSERNISAVILEKDSSKALRAVHSEFHLSRSVVSVVMVCDEEKRTQEIANACMKYLLDSSDAVVYDVVGTVHGNVFTRNSKNFKNDMNDMNDMMPIDMPLKDLQRWMLQVQVDNPMIIDCTRASTSFSNTCVVAWLEAGIKVVTANAHHISQLDEARLQYISSSPGSSSLSAAASFGSHFNARAALFNVLPVENAVKELIQCCASSVLRIQTVLERDGVVARAQIAALARAVGLPLVEGAKGVRQRKESSGSMVRSYFFHFSHFSPYIQAAFGLILF